MSTDPRRLLGAIAAHGLEVAAPVPAVALEDSEWTALLSVCHRQRLIGHLCDMVVRAAFPATEQQIREVIAWDLQLLDHRRRLDQLLTKLTARLQAEDIGCLVLKGPVLSRVAYQSADRRHYFDLDLLVPAEHMDDAVRLLAGEGFWRRLPPLRAGYDSRFAKSVTLRNTDRIELDLHRTLFQGPFGLRVDVADLWESSAQVAIEGAVVRCLSAEHNLMHACCNATLGDIPPRWSVLRDVVQLLTAAQIDSERFVESVERHRLGCPASEGISLALDALGVDIEHELVDWAHGYHRRRGDERRMRTYRERRSYAAQTLESVVVLSGIRDRARFITAAAFPSRTFLQSINSTRWQWMQRGQRSLHDNHRASRL